MESIYFNKSNICCISDIHLGVHQNNSSWHKILLDWVKWLDKQLIENDIDDIMICGDLFHYRDEIAVNSLHIANEFFDILKRYNIVMITGNHDCYYKDNSLVNSLSILIISPDVTSNEVKVITSSVVSKSSFMLQLESTIELVTFES